MKRISKENIRNIHHIFKEETGVGVPIKEEVVPLTLIVGIIIAVVIAGSLAMINKTSPANTKDKEVQLITYNSGQSGKEGFEVIADEGTSDEVTLKFDDWVWPTESNHISSFFGKREDGLETDHINVPGQIGDPVYAVNDGVILEADYEFHYGNYVVIKLDDKTAVKYGHLNCIFVAEGQQVTKGEEIGELGSSGCCTGPNLSFGVYIEDVGVNPLTK